MKRIFLLILLCLNLSLISGCGMVAMTAIETARGGSSEILIIQPIQNLEDYQSLSIHPFTSNVGATFNQELLGELNEEIHSDLSQFFDTTKSGKFLTVSGEVIHVADGVFEKLIIVQVKLNDSASEEPIGLVNITAEANSIRGLREGMNAVAGGLAALLAENQFSVLVESSIF